MTATASPPSFAPDADRRGDLGVPGGFWPILDKIFGKSVARRHGVRYHAAFWLARVLSGRRSRILTQLGSMAQLSLQRAFRCAQATAGGFERLIGSD